MWGYMGLGTPWGAYGLFSSAFGIVLFVDLLLLAIFLWIQIQSKR